MEKEKKVGVGYKKSQAGTEVLSFQSSRRCYTGAWGEEKGTSGCRRPWTLQVIMLTCQTGYSILCDRVTTVTGVTKYPDWIRGLPHKKEPTCSTTTLVKTPCLREVDTLSPKFLFKTRQMLLSALVREASFQREQWWMQRLRDALDVDDDLLGLGPKHI